MSQTINVQLGIVLLKVVEVVGITIDTLVFRAVGKVEVYKCPQPYDINKGRPMIVEVLILYRCPFDH